MVASGGRPGDSIGGAGSGRVNCRKKLSRLSDSILCRKKFGRVDSFFTIIPSSGYEIAKHGTTAQRRGFEQKGTKDTKNGLSLVT